MRVRRPAIVGVWSRRTLQCVGRAPRCAAPAVKCLLSPRAQPACSPVWCNDDGTEMHLLLTFTLLVKCALMLAFIQLDKRVEC